MNCDKLKTMYILCLLLLLAFLPGCTARQSTAPSRQVREFVDELGYRVLVTERPQRIYATTLSIEEVLVRLVEPERIAALSYEAADPSGSLIADIAEQIPQRLGSRPDVEAVLELKPDLVLAQDNANSDFVQTLRDFGIPVYTTKVPTRISAIRRRIAVFSELVGEQAQGELMIEQMDEKLNEVRERLSRIPQAERRMILAYSMLGAFGSEAGLFHDICIHAGVINGAAVAGLVRGEHMSKEQIVNINPEIFLLPLEAKVTEGNIVEYIDRLRRDPALQTVKAVQNNQFIRIHDRYRYCNSQFAADAAAVIAAQVYPEYF